MPCLTQPFSNDPGPLIKVGVSDINNSKVEGFDGLLDTGASHTCISKRVVDALSLPIVGKRESATASGMAQSNVYMGNFHLPMGATGYMIEQMPLSEFTAPDAFDLLIGRDIICMGHFTISYNGSFTFCL